MDAFAHARALVDRAHDEDPARTGDGVAAETVYADRMEAWVARLHPDASPLLRLAARCQHLQRWTVPRDSFPMDRGGYNAWRRLLYRQQADRARDLLLQAGIAPADAEQVALWVSKTGLLRDPGTQALEDAACLVFFEYEIEAFAAKHQDYTREKLLTILRKIWRKMSLPARQELIRLPMPETRSTLLREAVTHIELESEGANAPT
jgi:hypothetical protein